MIEYQQQAVTATPEEQEVVCGPDTTVRPAFMSLAAQYGIMDDMDIGDSGPNEQTMEQEYQAYLKSPPTSKTVNIIKYWEVIGELYLIVLSTDQTPQITGTAFLTLFQMAMDYLPIQASYVPCECVFSLSAEVDTKNETTSALC